MQSNGVNLFRFVHQQLDDFTNRIMISLTAQLVLAALFSSTTQSSVKTPYLKLIDVWYAVIITSCFLIIVLQTLINVIFHSNRLPGFVYKMACLPGPLSDIKKVRSFYSVKTICRCNSK